MAGKARPKAAPAAPKAAEPQLQTIAFTEAQAKRVAELQAAFNAAQGELQKFVTYLGDEYKPDPQKPWALTATGFVEQSPAAT